MFAENGRRDELNKFANASPNQNKPFGRHKPKNKMQGANCSFCDGFRESVLVFEMFNKERPPSK